MTCMVRWFIPALFILIVVGRAEAQELIGNRYYALSLDRGCMPIGYFTLSFSDNGTSDSADNETRTVGLLDISRQDLRSDNSSGTFIQRGAFYNGSWDATVKEYSSYYKENIYTYYSFLVFGIALLNESVTAGILYTTITEESEKKGRDEESCLVPYVGIQVTSASGQRAGCSHVLSVGNCCKK